MIYYKPIIMTAGQREFHERLRIKHLEIQKSILAQQEELRRVETELLLAQYGAWGPTVLKVEKKYLLSYLVCFLLFLYTDFLLIFLDGGSLCGN
jgi:hypothetical protein